MKSLSVEASEGNELVARIAQESKAHLQSQRGVAGRIRKRELGYANGNENQPHGTLGTKATHQYLDRLWQAQNALSKRAAASHFEFHHEAFAPAHMQGNRVRVSQAACSAGACGSFVPPVRCAVGQTPAPPLGAPAIEPAPRYEFPWKAVTVLLLVAMYLQYRRS
jgi:hypothetical protein